MSGSPPKGPIENEVDFERAALGATKAELWKLLADQVLINKMLLSVLWTIDPSAIIDTEGFKETLREANARTEDLRRSAESLILKVSADG